MEHLTWATRAQIKMDPSYVAIPLSIMPFADQNMVLPPDVYEQLSVCDIAQQSNYDMDLLSDSDEDQPAPAIAGTPMDTRELSTDTE